MTVEAVDGQKMEEPLQRLQRVKDTPVFFFMRFHRNQLPAAPNHVGKQLEAVFQAYGI